MTASPIPNRPITPAEWRWVSIVSILALLVSSLPMLAGYAAQTPDQRFVGTVYDVQDYFSNLAKAQLGLRGEYRYRSLFTSEPHASEPIIYFYILLGAVARLSGLSPQLIYELSRWSGGLVLLALIYKFIAYYIEAVAIRRLSFILALTASGLGWLLISTPAFSFPNQSPIEFWLADGYILFSIMAFAHFGWSIAAMLAAFLAWQAYADDPSPKRFVWLLAFSSLLGLIQIFELALFDLVIGLDALYRLYRDRSRWKSFFAAGFIIALTQFAILWPYLWATQTNPMIQVWTQQSRTLSPPPQYFLFGYGLLWVLVILGFIWAWRQRVTTLIFPALWLGAVALLLYSPDGIQYRWLEGVQVPLSIFAGLGLAYVARPWLLAHLPARWASPRAGWWITVLSFIILMPSSLYLVAGNTLLASIHWKEAYFTGGQMAGMNWLQANTQPDDIVLSDLKIGGALPGLMGHHPYYGHWAETMNVAAKKQLVEQFFSTMTDADRQALLHDNHIHYVFYGPDEQKLGAFNPSAVTYLSSRYQSGDTTIYAVVEP